MYNTQAVITRPSALMIRTEHRHGSVSYMKQRELCVSSAKPKTAPQNNITRPYQSCLNFVS